MFRRTSSRSGRAALIIAIAVLCSAGAVAYVMTSRDSQSSSEETRVPADFKPPPKPLFEGWDTPQAVLVFTGEQHGYLEPCGCTAGQIGGLARRADLVRLLTDEKQWPIASFDLGGALRDDRVDRRQELMKFETTRAALRYMNYDAMAYGPEEIRLTAGRLFDLFSAEQGAGDTSPDFLSANVSLFGDRETVGELGTPIEYQVVEAGNVRIAVTAIVGTSIWSRLFVEGLTSEQTLFGYEEPVEAISRVLPEMLAEEPDVLVLLSHATVDESRELAAGFGDFDVIVTAGGPEDGNEEPEIIGETLLLQPGKKGKAAGVVGVYAGEDEPELKFELVTLDGERFEHSPGIHALLEEYVARLERERPDREEPAIEHSSGAEFVGAEKCGVCHRKAFGAWSQSKHSHAFESLTKGRPDDENYIVRTFDAECLCCHTTGWDPQQALRYSSGFVDEETTPHLAGQQCENCHGPGSLHVELEEAFRAGGSETDELLSTRRALQLKKDEARTSLCIKCHDLDNSPTFDTDEKPFDTYWWPKVEHRGKD